MNLFKTPALNRRINPQHVVNEVAALKADSMSDFLAEQEVKTNDFLNESQQAMVYPEFVSPAPGSTSNVPTDTGFTGIFTSATGYVFNGTTYHWGIVAAGVLQVGGNDVAKFLAGAGAVTLDADGQKITGTGVLSEFISDGIISATEIAATDRVAKIDFLIDSEKTVTNGGFETGDLTGWTTLVGAPSVVSSIKRSGAYSLRLNVAGQELQSADYISISSAVGLLEFWFYGTAAGDSVNVYINCYNSSSVLTGGGANPGILTCNSTSVGAWRKYYCLFRYPSTTTKVKINFLSGGATTYIDDIKYYDGNGIHQYHGGFDYLPADVLSISGASTLSGAVTTGNEIASTRCIRFHSIKTGIADNVATGLFTITTTNETGSADAGSYTVKVAMNVMHGGAAGATHTAVKYYECYWVRAMRETGTGTNSAVTNLVATASVATNAAEKDISTVTPTVSETSEYVNQFNVQIDLTGTGITNARVAYNVELIWDFNTKPTIAAV